MQIRLTACVNYKELAVDQAKGSAGWPSAQHREALPPLLLPLFLLLRLPRRPHLLAALTSVYLVMKAETVALKAALGVNLAPVRAWSDFGMSDIHT